MDKNRRSRNPAFRRHNRYTSRSAMPNDRSRFTDQSEIMGLHQCCLYHCPAEHNPQGFAILSPAQGGNYSGSTLLANGTAPAFVWLCICSGQFSIATCADEAGKWRVPIDTCALNEGVNSLTATMQSCDCFGAQSQTVQFTYTPDTTMAPVIETPISGSSVSTPFTISGIAAKGVIVELFGLPTPYNVYANEYGHWAIDVTSLESGSYSIYAVSTDPCGRISENSNVVGFQVTAALSSPIIITPSNGGIYPEGEVLISGYAASGATVVVTIPDVVEGELVIANSAGFWSLATPPLSGDNAFVIEVYQLLPVMRFSAVTDSTFFIVSPLENRYVFGTVLSSATGFPVEGAVVTVGNLSAATDINGHYDIESLPEFPLDFTASAEGYNSEFVAGVVPTATGTEVNFVLPTSGPIYTGTLAVTVYDETGNPAPDAFVSVSLIGEAFERQAATDAGGMAVFTFLPEGTYGIDAASADQSFQGIGSAIVTANETSYISLTLNPPVIQPQLTLSILHTDGTPANGASIIMTQLNGDALLTATADAEGVARLSDLPVGIYAALATSAALSEQGSAVLSVTAEPAEATIYLIVATTPDSTNFIYGQVIESDNGLPVAGTVVSANGHSGITGNTGFYVLPALPADALNVTATAAGFEPAVIEAVPSILGTEADFSLSTVASGQSGNVSVTALNLGDTPAAGAVATVSKFGNPFQLTGITNTSGIANLSSIPVGTGAFVATSQDRTRQGSSIAAINANITNDVPIVLNQETGGVNNINWVFGTVTDSETGLPIAGATVYAGSRSVETNAQGNYILNTLPSAPLIFTASAAGYDYRSIIDTTPTPSGVNIDFALSED